MSPVAYVMLTAWTVVNVTALREQSVPDWIKLLTVLISSLMCAVIAIAVAVAYGPVAQQERETNGE